VDPLRLSRTMRLNQLPSVIDIPDQLSALMTQLKKNGLSQKIPVEACALVCYDGESFSLGDKSFGSKNSCGSGTDHKGDTRIGFFHTHPKSTPIDVNDLNMMLDQNRVIENFSLVEGADGSRSALFRTVDSPTMITPKVQTAEQKKPNDIVEAARITIMGYYQGTGTTLRRVYPK
jgi:hypothetical protein